MLRKLMKYELRATARVMLPLYLAVAGLAAVLRLLVMWSDHVSVPSTLLIDPVSLLLRLVTVAFILAMVAVHRGRGADDRAVQEQPPLR